MINSLFSKMPILKELEDQEKRFSNNISGSVGKGHWRAFLERNSHKTMVSKRSQKYEVDRPNWTTYAKFLNMYQPCIDQNVHDGMAKKRVTHQFGQIAMGIKTMSQMQLDAK